MKLAANDRENDSGTWQIHRDISPARLSKLVQVLATEHIPQVRQPPYSLDITHLTFSSSP